MNVEKGYGPWQWQWDGGDLILIACSEVGVITCKMIPECVCGDDDAVTDMNGKWMR